jgi:8-oxo-dGTP pyrophosphatase MutT (NUDIX family)
MSTELSDVPEAWPVTATRHLYRADWVMALREDEITAPGSPEKFSRWVFEHPGAVIVLAVDGDDRAFCLRQYRHPARRRFVELPAGLLDQEDEPPLEAARRELREEARLEADEWTALASIWSSPGISSEVMHLFLARGLRDVLDDDFEATHEEADMSTDWVPLTELLAAVLDGRLGDGPLVQTLLLAQAKGLLG